mgnify:CR=1 FL=1
MGKRPKERVTLPAVVEESWALGVQEASAVAPLADGSLLVVDDEQGVFHCRRGETPVVLAAIAGLADLEGLCLDPAGERAWVLAERDGSVWRYQVEGGDFDHPRVPDSHPHLRRHVLYRLTRADWLARGDSS